jgi:Protein export membrane protein
LLPILSLLLFGGQTLKDFAFAMFVGVAIGAYSSIFIAAPVLTVIHERQVKRNAARAPASRRARERVPAAATAVASDAAATSATAGMAATPRPKPKPRNKKGQPAKRKRR